MQRQRKGACHVGSPSLQPERGTDATSWISTDCHSTPVIRRTAAENDKCAGRAPNEGQVISGSGAGREDSSFAIRKSGSAPRKQAIRRPAARAHLLFDTLRKNRPHASAQYQLESLHEPATTAPKSPSQRTEPAAAGGGGGDPYGMKSALVQRPRRRNPAYAERAISCARGGDWGRRASARRAMRLRGGPRCSPPREGAPRGGILGTITQ